MSSKPAEPAQDGTSVSSDLDFPVVGIGASAGGLAAIKTLLDGLPPAPDMAFVVVLHLSPKHESNAAAILQSSTRMPVAQVTGPVHIERNHVYVIPPTYDLSMVDGSLGITASERVPGKHVVIDLFFRTLADAHGVRAVGIVLSGTGSDGSTGIARLKEQGGIVLAQSPDDAEYDDMPKNAVATGKVDIVLPAAEMAERLVELWRNAKRIELPDGEQGRVRHPSRHRRRRRRKMRCATFIKLLHQRTGHDFRHYKRATVLRRIERRMQVTAIADLPSYRTFLDEDPMEAKALLADMLIGVTQFFRDRTAFEALERDVLPKLFEGGDVDSPVRAWVPACSSGEEAYSIAMLLADEAARKPGSRSFTVFATDIDEESIAIGRSGAYPESIATDVPPTRLRQHFAAEPNIYRIHKSLREKVIFAMHNVLRDPPFSRVDLISCRNLLIYLDRTAQQAVLEMFHFALRPGGYLFLGNSESVDATARLFTPIDKSMRIFRPNPIGRVSRPLQQLAFATHAANPGKAVQQRGLSLSSRSATPAEVHQQLLESVAPASILLTSDYDIVHVSARAAAYLRYVEGEPSHNLVTLIRDDLRQDLRTALFQAVQLHEGIDAPPVRVTDGNSEAEVRMSVRPVRHDAWAGEMLLVIFTETPLPIDAAPAVHDSARVDARQLEAELHNRSNQLAATIDQYESSAEELKASNEELQAINEELRSTTEELETSKEELQSTNEELITVNHELKTKIDETSEVNDDLKNLITSTDIATVFVDAAMRIKRFTPASASLFNIIASDIGRSLFDITHKLDYPGLADDAKAVFSTLKATEREVRSADGRRLLARLRPYRTTEDRIGGAVITFVDVTSLREAEAQADIGRERMQLVVEAMTDFAVLTISLEGRIASWSTGAESVFGHTHEQAIGSPFDILFTAEDRAAGAPAEEMRIAERTGHAPDERWMLRRDGTRFFASGVTSPLRAAGIGGYAKICRDRTEMATVEELRSRQLDSAQRGAAEAFHANELKNEFLAIMSHELKHPLNLINVNAQLLTTLPEAQGLPSVLRAARTIQRTVQGQARIIDDLLDMSRSNTGKLALNRVPLLLSEAIQSCMTWALAEARAKGLRLFIEGFDDPIVVDGDATRVEQIAWNLVSNAIKFSRSGSAITVRTLRDGEDALLEVVDGGRGISAAFLPHVFEMFKQADAPTTRGEGGLGIGLALVKNLAELHGGRVDVLSEGEGRGATFRVWLPMHRRTDFAPLSDAADGKSPLAGVRVLLVDDTADTLETFGYLLGHEGATVTTASSGEQALALIDSMEFDLVISDVGMPHMDGYEMMTQLRTRPALATLPAIALTGYGRPQDVQKALASGFQAHLDKPVDFERLKDVSRALLAAAKAT